ncbi:Flp family type IVb pilin [Novosphingobium album (ex Hu et al. 2023)]|uniref:Flp family type IVb pilin n=1 Tax=Novosphingobium album (ex Hu et al. 2023) TaxID=2930093 RepID=A0ABT0B0Y9_9SPHN|nr:Flp family type IVb pilin [Novosphingobium album (ex Hu et al. 2023)]MCJ2178714.1 Flp family type IVb pilin [Novosphingobium album (ex Hu et al. 2023)]
MTKFLNAFVRDESGAAAAEYVLILAIIGTGIAAGAIALGDAIGTALQSAATVIGGYTYG